MEKNDYLLINDSIYQLYSCETLIEAKATLLNRLKLITNYTYASIMMSVQIDNERRLADPFCNPKSLEAVEQEYSKMESLDHNNWINYSKMSELIHESDIMEDSKMLTTPIYEKCYKKYNIYDMVQLSIV